MTRVCKCDNPACGAIIPDTTTYYRVDTIAPVWEEHDNLDFCSLACLAAWATERAQIVAAQQDTTAAVPADVWAETVKAMD